MTALCAWGLTALSAPPAITISVRQPLSATDPHSSVVPAGTSNREHKSSSNARSYYQAARQRVTVKVSASRPPTQKKLNITEAVREVKVSPKRPKLAPQRHQKPPRLNFLRPLLVLLASWFCAAASCCSCSCCSSSSFLGARCCLFAAVCCCGSCCCPPTPPSPTSLGNP